MEVHFHKPKLLRDIESKKKTIIGIITPMIVIDIAPLTVLF